MSHWVTTATPHFFEPMRTAATFKMLPDPAFVVSPSCTHSLPHSSPCLRASHLTPVTLWSVVMVIAMVIKAIVLRVLQSYWP